MKYTKRIILLPLNVANLGAEGPRLFLKISSVYLLQPCHLICASTAAPSSLQVEGVRWLWSLWEAHKGGILGDDMVGASVLCLLSLTSINLLTAQLSCASQLQSPAYVSALICFYLFPYSCT